MINIEMLHILKINHFSVNVLFLQWQVQQVIQVVHILMNITIVQIQEKIMFFLVLNVHMSPIRKFLEKTSVQNVKMPILQFSMVQRYVHITSLRSLFFYIKKRLFSHCYLFSYEFNGNEGMESNIISVCANICLSCINSLCTLKLCQRLYQVNVIYLLVNN